MAAAKTERLLNLVIALLAARRPLTRDQVRSGVPGYSDSDEAFERMFERDKDELRELGVPVETVPIDPYFDDELGYLIPRTAYELPPIHLDADEAAALTLAARTWQQQSLAATAAGGLLKLRAASGGTVDDGSRLGIEPRLDASEAAFGPLWTAVRERRTVSFDHRGPASASPARRTLDPWGIVCWHGRWYVVGHDRDRDAERVFRLSRVVGAVRPVGRAGAFSVPDGVDVRALVARRSPETAVTGTARLHVAPDAALPLRRRAVSAVPVAGGDPPGDEVVVEVGDVENLADELVTFGGDVVVLEPEPLRDAVLRRLRAVAEAHA